MLQGLTCEGDGCADRPLAGLKLVIVGIMVNAVLLLSLPNGLTTVILVDAAPGEGIGFLYAPREPREPATVSRRQL